MPVKIKITIKRKLIWTINY